MASNYFKVKKGLNLENLASSVSAKGDIAYNSATDKLELYNGAVDPLVNEAKAATLTNKTLDAGSNTISNITNTNLSGSAGITDANLATISTAGKVSNSATTATSANTTNAIVARDGSGNFFAGTITASLTGNATNVTGVIALLNGGTGQSTKAPAFDALSPMTTGGDIIYGGTSGTGTRLPNGSSGQVLTSNGGTSAPSWAAVASAPTSPFFATNIGLSCSIGSNALTIALKQSDGSADPSTGAAAVQIGFRSATATSGGYNYRSVTSATSIVVPSGASLGQTNAMNQYVFVYAMDNAGTVELAVSGVQLFADKSIQSSTTIGAGSTSGTVLYSTTGRSNLPIRLIGQLLVNETTAGTWASVPSDVVVMPSPSPTITDVVTYTPTFTGFGTVSDTLTFTYRRVGDSMEIQGRFTVGTPTAVEARVSLPSGFTSSGSSKLPSSIQNCGVFFRKASSTDAFKGGSVLIEQSVTYMTMTSNGVLNSSSVNPFQKVNGTDGGTGDLVGFTMIKIPIQGWSTYGP